VVRRVVVAAVMLGLLGAGPAGAAKIKLGEPAVLGVDGREAFAISAEVRVPAGVAAQVAEVRTSPFDVARFPIGEYSVGLLEQNLPRVLGGNGAADRPTVVIELGIEQFEARIPTPAYKPYSASVVYSVRVVGPDGQTLLEQVATGSSQTSSGMLSGFKAKKHAAEAATGAMNEAMTRLLEGLLDSEELAAVEAGTAGPAEESAEEASSDGAEGSAGPTGAAPVESEAGETAGETAGATAGEVSDPGGRGTCAGPR
jgi:hypothetical protein